MRNLSLGISPCPNDTYIFEALVHQRLEKGYRFDLFMEDVEKLNQLAFENRLDITKVSIHAAFYLFDRYLLLNSGGALGKSCGPLLLNKTGRPIKSGTIALPGKHTTASLLFGLAFEGDFTPVYMPFDKIIQATAQGEVDAGVIIHESRFTYPGFGLKLVEDLGKWWEEKTGCLLPLGGILVSKDLEASVRHDLQVMIKESIEFADMHPAEVRAFIKQNAQEMKDEVIDSHIGLYVNEYSKDMGEEGRLAVMKLYEMGVEQGLIVPVEENKEEGLFVH